MPTTYTVLLHDTWGNARDGWEVNQSFKNGTITVEKSTAPEIIRALRDLGLNYDSSRMAPLGRAIRSSPYMGGHIDLNERNGKPLGFLECHHE